MALLGVELHDIRSNLENKKSCEWPISVWSNDAAKGLDTLVFGEKTRELFLLDKETCFLNHGSYGSVPKVVFDAQMQWKLKMQENPVQFNSNKVLKYITNSLINLSEFVGSDPEDLVFVENASTGVCSVLESYPFDSGDTIVYLDLLYQAVDYTLQHVANKKKLTLKQVTVDIPVDFDRLLVDFEKALDDKTTKMCVIDHITSKTGLVLPIEKLIEIAHKKNVKVLVDGAHAVGQVPINLKKIGADFYTSNCHKWLFAPVGCAFLYVKKEYQNLIYPLCTSHGFKEGYNARFGFTATRDYTAYFTMNTALFFYKAIGQDRITEYNRTLVRNAADMLIKRWNTNGLVKDTSDHAFMVTVRLPDSNSTYGGSKTIGEKSIWVAEELFHKHKVEVPILVIGDKIWTRISAQIYNKMSDYKYFAEAVEKVLS
eukprot:TRINITY_DN4710_c0_g1_i1.p1 TRINITY_DN4710_c0_g1~~TRINITY_DN4710_c0_g1_i1.p1  ORF type:complete len:428 (-),score=72.32 TRINITY_DN4710_c0_g1_i1:81-1364(-)